MRNNRRKVIHKTGYDLLYDRKLKENTTTDTEKTVTEIKNMYKEIFAPQEYVAYGNNDILTSSMRFYKENHYGDERPMNEAIKVLNEQKFFDVVTGKSQKGSTLIKKTIDLNNKLNYSSQKVKANASLETVKEAYTNLQNLIANKGKLHVYDLETIGGNNRNGVWSPIGITEFSAHTKNFATGETIKTDIFLGMSREEADKLQAKIFKAIDNGSLDSDGDLAVTAMRMSMYGNEKTVIEKNDKGYYEVKKFVSGDEARRTSKQLIKEGFDKHVEAYENTSNIKGLKASEKAVLDKIAEMQQDLLNKNAMLGGFNNTKFDDPITNKYLSDIVVKNKNIILNSVDPTEKQNALATLNYYDKLFNIGSGGKAVLSPEANQVFDMRAAVDLYKGYFGIDSLYAGNKDYTSIGPQMARQEHIAGAHFPTKMAQGNAHQASFDVEMLTEMFLGKSELTGQNFLDYIMNGDGLKNKGINSIEETTAKLSVGNQLFKAKNTSTTTSYTAQGHLNFVHDRKTNKLYTADGYEIGNKSVKKLGFDLGAKVNRNQFYTIGGIQKLDATSEWGEMISQIMPELSTQDLFSLRLDIQIPDKYKTSVLGDTSRYFLFKSEAELEAFMSSNFNMVAEKNADGIFEILRDNDLVRKELEIRKLKHNKNGTTGMVLQKDFWKMSDEEILAKNIELSTERLLASRAENAITGSNSFKKSQQLLKIQSAVEKKLGKITGLELSQIMSGEVTSGNILGKIDKKGLSNLQKEIIRIAGYNGKLHDTTKTSFAVSYDVLTEQSDALKMIFNQLGESKKIAGLSQEGKQIVFDNVLKTLKMQHATEYYGNNTDKIRNAVLNNREALMSTSEIMNYFEVNLGGFAINNKATIVDMARPESTKDLFRINLESGKEYDLVNKLLKAKYGDSEIAQSKKDVYAVDVLSDFMKRLEDQIPSRGKNAPHYNGIRSLANEMQLVRDKKAEINPYEFSTRLLSEFRKIKELNPVAGIINTNTTMSALIDTDKKLIKDFNNYVDVDKVKAAIDAAPNIINFKTEKDIKNYVDNVLIKYYMPNKDEFLNGIMTKNSIQKNAMESLYDTTRAGHVKNLTEIITTATSVGANVSVQDDGTLMLIQNGEYVVLDRIAKTKLHKDSGILYHQVGLQSVVANNKVAMNMSKGNAKISLTSNLEDINKSMGDVVKQMKINYKNGTFDLSSLEYTQTRIAKGLLENSSLQSFNAHDMKSNYRLDFGDIKYLLPDLFNDNGQLRDKMTIIENRGGFRDRNLIETMKKLIDGKTELDEMSPAMKHNILKNVQDILLELVGNDPTLREIIKGSNFSAKENQVAELVAHIGERYLGSAATAFDNNARPVIAQSGRGFYIRTSDVDKAIKEAPSQQVLFKGSLFNTDSSKNEMFRNVNGIGETTTNVSFRRRFVGSTSLKVILDTNYDKVLEQAKVENMTVNQINKLYAQLYDSINTFEQERHIDSRVFENTFGRAADIQRLSIGADIMKPIESKTIINEQEADYYKKLINMIGDISLEDGQLVYKKDVGKLVQKGDKLIEYASYGDTTKAWTSKIHNGVLNYGFFSDTSKLQLNEEDITKIINKNKDLFMDDNNNLLDSTKLRSNLIKLLEKEGFTSQYFVEDVNRIGYAKLMDDEVEKGMTKVDYVKLGAVDEKVAGFFTEIGHGRFVGNNVLTDNAFDAAIAEGTNVDKALKKFGYKNIEDVRRAVSAERHLKSKITYDYIFKGATELANDATAKHGNKGSMMLGAFSELVMSTANHLGYGTGEEGRDKALKTIFDFMDRDESYQFLTKTTLDKKVRTERLKMQRENGYVKLLEDFATGAIKFDSIDNKALEKLIVDMNEELGFTGDNNLVHKGITLLTGYKDGKYEYASNQTYIGRAQFETVGVNTVNGYKKLENVLVSTESIVAARAMEDPETQTGISQAYFDRKLEIVKLKKEYAKTGDPSYLTEANKLQGELAGFSDVVKQMGISDQEISIMEMSELNDASETVLNKLKDNKFLESDAFRGMTTVNEDGSLALKKELKNKKLLKNFTDQYRDLVLFDHTSEIELTPELLAKEEYSHLRQQYDLAHIKGRKIGVETAEKFHNLNMANMAYEFDSAMGNLKNHEFLIKNGFEEMDINDFVSNHGKRSDIIDSIANRHLLIDLGKDFEYSSKAGNSRYIAIPGLGSLIGDSEVKADYQSKLNALSNDVLDYQYWLNQKGADSSETTKAYNKVKYRAEEIKELVSDIYKKNGVMHESTKVLAPSPSYRLKASGANGEFFRAEMDSMQLLDMWEVKNQRALSVAQINGRSIMDWEKDGVYYDYKFMSKDQFRAMGYYDEEYMSKLGIKSEAEMTEYLKTHGTLDISDRYPNIMSTSMVTTRAYLDETLTSNQAKISRVTTLKYNGDFDGDSTSAHLLRVRSTDANGNYNFEDYAQYNQARLKAKEVLGEGASEEDIRRLATTSDIKVSTTTYDEFRAIDLGMSLDAVDTNQYWARKVEEKMAEDAIKTGNNLRVSKIAAVKDGESILGKQHFTQLGEVVDLKTFNENEAAINLRLKELYGENANVRDFNDIGEGLDKALVDYEEGMKAGKFSQEAFEKFQADAIMRYRIEKYDQELMSKGSKGIIGSANISLNATKLASRSIYGGDGPDRNVFRDELIWKVNYIKEQDPISGKKLTLGYDENRIDEYADISRRLFSTARGDKKDLLTSQRQMAQWMDDYIGNKEAFAEFYDNNLGKYISNTTHKNIMRGADLNDSNAVMMAKYSYIKNEYINAITDLGSNKMAQSYLDMYNSMGKGGDRFLNRQNAAMAASNQDTMTGIAMSQLKTDFVDRGMEESALYTSKREAVQRVKQSHVIDDNPLMKTASSSVISGVNELASSVSRGGGGGRSLAMGALGIAAGLMISGFAAGNPLNDADPQTVTQSSSAPQSIPQFLDEQGGYVTGDSQRGYIINIKADSKKGRKHMERAMKQAAEASVGGAVSVNMNIRNSRDYNISDRDIEKYIENHL